MMDGILYSFLTSGNAVDPEEWEGLLGKGIKVICFLSDEKKKFLEKTIKKYAEHPYFKVYNDPYQVSVSIVDGVISDEARNGLAKLAAGDDRFNMEQYLVEHADIAHDLCVEAGAGTGKTTVMIDRIMYLFHMDPKFSFAKVAMITFTNKATDNMRHKLLDELKRRYSLTHDLRYLKGLEEVSQISISTIHAFFKRILVEVGPLMGYGTDLQMRSYVQEKRELLRDLLDRAYGNSKVPVISKFGLSLNDMERLASGYWDKMENNGLTDEEIAGLDWGHDTDPIAEKIQQQLRYIFSQVNTLYNERKLVNNAISMKDIIHELGRVVHLEETKGYLTSSFDYIFCDEFQDTDMVQIKTISLLAQIYKCKLFVVGDIKQSIYRFRGATDAAFQRLIERSSGIDFKPASLVKNYRTSKTIMDRLDRIFVRWNEQKFIRYETKDKLQPRNLGPGIYRQIKVTDKSRKDIVMAQIKEIMRQDDTAVITVLTRTNNELQQIRAWCEADGDIVHQIKERGSFFRSAAVLDMCAVLEGLLYEGVPMYVWESCNTPYVERKETINYEELKSLEGNTYHLLKKLYSYMDDGLWGKYRKDIKDRPVLSVIREMVDGCKPVERYALTRVRMLKQQGLDDEDVFTQATLDTRSYKANLEKLLQMLQDRFGPDFSSLYDICAYLRIRIETDTDEEQAPIERKTEKGYVEGYTVHSAKGLQFEHVFIPFMDFSFVSDFRSEILLSDDNTEIGWVYRKRDKNNKINEIASSNYKRMKKKEDLELIRDETRLLYVAMTRAIRSLYCFPTRRYGADGINDWSGLLAKEEDNA